MANVTTTTYTKTIVLKPGEIFTLPPNATVLTVSGDLSASDCILPEPEPYSCFTFDYSIGNAGGGATDVLEDDQVVAESITSLGIIYPLNRDHLQDPQLLADAIKTALPDGMIQIVGTTTQDFPARKDLIITFKTFESIASGMEIKFVGDGYPNMYIKPVKIDDCA